jgi:tRNA(Ile)-lysidine synthase
MELVVGTVDHQLRRGSAADAAFVERLSKSLGLPCRSARVAVGERGGVEASARRARYAALRKMARDQGCALIATGHTMEDQAETVLLRLGRGAGLRGLRGILARRGSLVRPLLECSRAEVADYLASRGVRPRLDPTNRSHAMARNRVRALVLPALEQALGTGAIRSLARSAEIAALDDRALESLVRRKARRLLTSEHGLPAGEVDAVLKLAPALQRRLLLKVVRDAGARPSRERIEAMLSAIASPHPRTVQIADRLELDVRYGRFRIRRAAAVPPAGGFERILAGPGTYRFAEARVEVAAVGPSGRAMPDAILLAPERLALPLRLRTRRPGDRFRPRGGGSKKLKAYLIDRKLPREQRDALLLLADASGQVLWIVGVAQSQAAADAEGSTRAWRIRVRTPGKRATASSVK